MSKAHRIIATGSAIGALLAGATMAAPPAAATEVSAALCQVAPEGEDVTGAIYVLKAGDVLTFTLPDGCAPIIGDSGDVEVLDPGSEFARARFLGPESFTFIGSQWESEPTTATIVVGVGCGNTEWSEFVAELVEAGFPVVDLCQPAGPGPAPVLQQTAPLPDGSCDIVDPTLDWAGVEPGGWSRSWAEWVDEGTGGVVCTRTLAYSESSGRWAVTG